MIWLSNSIKISRKLPGATLMEALIAMIIISVTITISAVIYLNVTDQSEEYMTLKAISVIEQHHNNSVEEKTFIDKEINSGQMELIIRCELKYDGLILVNYRAFFNDHLLLTRQYLERQ